LAKGSIRRLVTQRGYKLICPILTPI